jgi:hypothetical protein
MVGSDGVPTVGADVSAHVLYDAEDGEAGLAAEGELSSHVPNCYRLNNIINVRLQEDKEIIKCIQYNLDCHDFNAFRYFKILTINSGEP